MVYAPEWAGIGQGMAREFRQGTACVPRGETGFVNIETALKEAMNIEGALGAALVD